MPLSCHPHALRPTNNKKNVACVRYVLLAVGTSNELRAVSADCYYEGQLLRKIRTHDGQKRKLFCEQCHDRGGGLLLVIGRSYWHEELDISSETGLPITLLEQPGQYSYLAVAALERRVLLKNIVLTANGSNLSSSTGLKILPQKAKSATPTLG